MADVDGSLSADEAAPLVLIVILNYNDCAGTIAAVQSVLALEYARFQVLLVDNASPDGSAERLRGLAGERVEFVASAVNLGFAGGCNLGFERALAMEADFVWLLNNDAEVPPGTLASLIRLAESDPRIGLATPLIASLDEAPHITFAGGVLDMEAGIYDETNDLAEAAGWAANHPDKGLAIGTAMLVRTELIRTIGMLDERFFMYFEDIDYSARSLAAGYRNVVDADATVYHLEKNKSTNPRAMLPHYWYYNARNVSRFWGKHRGVKSARQLWWAFNAFLRFRNECRGNAPACEAILAGIWDGWRNRGGAYDPGRRMPRAAAALVELYSRRGALQPRASA